MHNILLILSLFLLKNFFCQSDKTPILITNPNDKFELIGELGVALGTTVTVTGKIIEGPFKGNEGGPNLMIQSINDSANQKSIYIPITPYFYEFGENSMPSIVIGNSYRFRVYESGGYVGIPSNALKEANIMIQTTGFYFRNELVVISGEEIEEIKASPADFEQRDALISGISKNINDTAYIVNSQWRLKLTDAQKWEQNDLHKEAEVYGTIKKTENKDVFTIENATPRLVRLEDLEYKTVHLRGIAMSMNGKWWFNYRGNDIYVEKMKDLPNWTTDNHFRPMEITGLLLPIDDERIDKSITLSNSYCHGNFVIINASWKPIDGLLNIEK